MATPDKISKPFTIYLKYGDSILQWSKQNKKWSMLPPICSLPRCLLGVSVKYLTKQLSSFYADVTTEDQERPLAKTDFETSN